MSGDQVSESFDSRTRAPAQPYFLPIPQVVKIRKVVPDPHKIK